MKQVLITLLVSSIFLIDKSNAVQEEKTLTIEGPQSSHTLDDEGNFKHPFLGSEHVDRIHYPDSSTFSVKLN